ncbi:hypothetical protein BC941DRAFT_509228 [Chlamydoabsidia padenii]|nr:hypothetical protein BC941DRAFT_509228 [Chlamydoabsidia padenii]
MMSLPQQQATLSISLKGTSSDNNTTNGTIIFIANQVLTSFYLSSHHETNTIYPSSLLPTRGHTTHWIDNTLVSIFGKPNQPPITIVETQYSPPSVSIQPSSSSSSSSPSRRYAHTTTLIHNNNNTTQLFLIGGSTIDDDQPQSDIWALDWLSKTWSKLAVQGDPFSSGLMGHVALAVYRSHSTHLLTCFGANHHTYAQHCTLFNTKTMEWKRLTHHSSSPTARIHASLIPANDTHAILYGGLSDTLTLLDDLWWVHVKEYDTSGITFTFLGHSIPRAGHVATMISEKLMLVKGGDDKDTTIVDLESSYDGNQRYHKRRLTLRSITEDVGQGAPSSTVTPDGNDGGTTNGISGGAIGGIVVAVFALVGIILFVFYQRRKRQQRNYDLHSRAARFSLSTPPRPSESYVERRSMAIQQPEAAKTRLSHMSFGSEFGVSASGLRTSFGSSTSLPQPVIKSKPTMSSTMSSSSTSNLPASAPPLSISTNNNNHPDLLDSPSRQLYTNWICETPVPPVINPDISIDPRHTSMYINQSMTRSDQEDDHDSGEDGTKKRSSIAFKRLRLSLFKPLDVSITEYNDTTSASLDSAPSSNTPDDTTNATKRRSSMFGLTKLLNLGDRHEQQKIYPHLQVDPRDSLGSKSVASLQWVEFNNDMDFSGNLTPRQLAVMNHRQSCATLSSGSGFGSGYVEDHSRPTSPRSIITMAQQLQQHHRQHQQQQHRLSQRELSTWDDTRLSRMITSPPHRLAIRDPTKSSSFPTLAPIHID